MKIIQVTPSGQKSNSGNGVTARRWTHIFCNLGHKVTNVTEYDGQSADMMVAIHAWRSAKEIECFKKLYPDRPLVVCLAGTDINEYIYSHPKVTIRSLELADVLVCLHDLVKNITPRHLRHKLQVIYQSAKPLYGPRKPSIRNFDICVVGNLRKVKDPMRAALAARVVPAESRIRIIHFGRAYNQTMADNAIAEMSRNPRYIWKGEVPRWRVRQELKKTRLMVLSSKAEGGANVISEAVVAGVPVVASKIDGNVGLLERSYCGYYPLGDTLALRDAMLKAETNSAHVDKLTAQCQTLALKFTIKEEQARWHKLFSGIN